MSVNQRAGNFLHRLANSDSALLTVSRRVQDRSPHFVRALKVMLPALLLSAASHAQTPVPAANFQVDQSKMVSIESVASVLDRAIQDSQVNLDDLRTVASCLREHSGYKGQDMSLMLSMATASVEVNQDISRWGRETGRDTSLAVAAFCQNPLDWKGQIATWDAKAEQFGGKPGDELRHHMANRALDTFQAQTHTMQLVVSDVVENHEGHGIYGAQAMHVRGTDWANAAISIAKGGAALLGDRDAQQAIQGAATAVSRGTSHVRRGEGIAKRRDPAAQIRGIGDLMGAVGRDVNRPSRATTRVRNTF